MPPPTITLRGACSLNRNISPGCPSQRYRTCRRAIPAPGAVLDEERVGIEPQWREPRGYLMSQGDELKLQ